MNITLVAATKFEIKENIFTNTKHNIQFLYTGVGMLVSAVSLTQWMFQHKPDWMIQLGIAGAFNNNFLLGDVVVVEKEYLGDTGVWENGEWKDVFDLNLVKKDQSPFINKYLQNQTIDALNVLHLPKVTGVTINQITTNEFTKKVVKTKYNADIESMEGASLHYVCSLFSVPFLQVRSISNYVGERDKTKWKMKEAIENVNEAVRKMLEMTSSQPFSTRGEGHEEQPLVE